MTQYVLGFIFDKENNVVLIEKQKPESQKGLLNGIGGKVESKDPFISHAMYRECKEETALEITPAEWSMFGALKDLTYTVHLFFTEVESVFAAKQMEKEKLVFRKATDCILYKQPPKQMHNLPFLVNYALMCRDFKKKDEHYPLLKVIY